MIFRARVAEILETFGARPDRWPEAEREAVRAALEADARLQTLAAREAALDGWLAEWEGPRPREAAIEALLAASQATAQEVVQDREQSVSAAWMQPVRRRERWLSGGGAVGLAAGIVALIMLAGTPDRQSEIEVQDTSMISLAFSADQSEGWL